MNGHGQHSKLRASLLEVDDLIMKEDGEGDEKEKIPKKKKPFSSKLRTQVLIEDESISTGRRKNDLLSDDEYMDDEEEEKEEEEEGVMTPEEFRKHHSISLKPSRC